MFDIRLYVHVLVYKINSLQIYFDLFYISIFLIQQSLLNLIKCAMFTVNDLYSYHPYQTHFCYANIYFVEMGLLPLY